MTLKMSYGVTNENIFFCTLINPPTEWMNEWMNAFFYFFKQTKNFPYIFVEAHKMLFYNLN